jgi:SOS-response transcriptional repressor LexA
MPAAESVRPKEGQFAVLDLALPGRAAEACGVLLLDPSSDELHFRLRRDWNEVADEENAELLELLAEDLRGKAAEMGGECLVRYFEDSQSNFLRISNRETVEIHGSADLTIKDLYRSHVRPKVLPFRTHLPVFYTLRAAAGSFSPERDAGEEPQDWLEAPDDVRLREDMFIARVEGRSMEPRIPDQSLCIFRANPAGSRQGKILLVERIGNFGSEVTIKVYRSTKVQSSEGNWKHEQITMEPLNPEFSSWTLQEGEQLHVIAEFVEVFR